MRPRLWTVWVLGIAVGASTGVLWQRWSDEREFLVRMDLLREKVRKADDRCDDAAVGIAEAVLAYRGGR